MNIEDLHIEGENQSGWHKIPEGLHVYSLAVSRGNTTPAGVARPSVSWYFYKHLMPACSADRPLASGKKGEKQE